MQNQENLTPAPAELQREVGAETPRQQGRAVAAPSAANNGSYPVRNTFIHYGTPLRSAPRTMASPKTVPPNFAPEQALLFDGVEPMNYYGAPPPPLFLCPGGGAAPALPPTQPPQGSPPRVAASRPAGAGGYGAEAPTQRGAVAPLRLFDFLPSPSASVQASVPGTYAAAPAPSTCTTTPTWMQNLAPPAMPGPWNQTYSGQAYSGTPTFQQGVPMGTFQMPPPPPVGYGPELCAFPQQGFQQQVGQTMQFQQWAPQGSTVIGACNQAPQGCYMVPQMPAQMQPPPVQAASQMPQMPKPQ